MLFDFIFDNKVLGIGQFLILRVIVIFRVSNLCKLLLDQTCVRKPYCGLPEKGNTLPIVFLKFIITWNAAKPEI